jgi:hypothetical protein
MEKRSSVSLQKTTRDGERSIIHYNKGGIVYKTEPVDKSTKYYDSENEEIIVDHKYNPSSGSIYIERSVYLDEDDIKIIEEKEEEEEEEKEKILLRYGDMVTVGLAFYNKTNQKTKGIIGIFQNQLKYWHIEASFPVREFCTEEESKTEYMRDKQMAFGIFRNDTTTDSLGTVTATPGTVFLRPRSFASSKEITKDSVLSGLTFDPKRLKSIALGQTLEVDKGVNNYEFLYFDVHRDIFEKVKPWIKAQVGMPYDLYGFYRMLLWPKPINFFPSSWYCINLIVCLLQRLGIIGFLNPYAVSTDELYEWLNIYPHKKFDYTRHEYNTALKYIGEV